MTSNHKGKPMKLSMTRESLQLGLAVVGPVLNDKTNHLPILRHVLLEAGPKGLTITATDLDQTICATVAADVSIQGRATVLGKRLAGIAKLLSGDVVKLGMAERQVRLDCGRSSFKLDSMPVEEFPEGQLTDAAFGETWSLDATTLASAAEDVAFAASDADSRPALRGVLWQCRGKAMRAVATDSHRLALRELGERKKTDDLDVSVPVPALQAAARMFAGEKTVKVSQSATAIRFQSNGYTLVSRLIVDPFPAYERLMAPVESHAATIEREPFIAALKRLGVVSETPYKMLTDWRQGLCTLTATAQDVGTAREDVGCEFTGGALSIAFNLHYLLDALQHFDSESVHLSFSESARVVLLTPVGGEGYTQLLACLQGD